MAYWCWSDECVCVDGNSKYITGITMNKNDKSFWIIILCVILISLICYAAGYSQGINDGKNEIDPYQYYWYGMNDLMNLHLTNHRYIRSFPDGGEITFFDNKTYLKTKQGTITTHYANDYLDINDPWDYNVIYGIIENESFVLSEW